MAINKDLLHKAMLKNCTTYFEQTKDLRNVDALRDREHVLQVLLHSDAMTEIPQYLRKSAFIFTSTTTCARRWWTFGWKIVYLVPISETWKFNILKSQAITSASETLLELRSLWTARHRNAEQLKEGAITVF
jgi:hypothetical protein